MYDPVIGRWHCPDPLQQFHSPYLYAANNPLIIIDPSGAWSYNVYVNGKLWNTVSGDDEDDKNNTQEPQLAGSESLKTGSNMNSSTQIDGSNVSSAVSLGLGSSDEILSNPKVYKGLSKVFGLAKASKTKEWIEVAGAFVSMASIVNIDSKGLIDPSVVLGTYDLSSALFSILVEMIVSNQIAEQDEFQVWLAGQNMDMMKSYVNTVQSEMGIKNTFFFIYASEKTDKTIFSISPTPYLFESASEAEKVIGFTPKYVYFNTLKNITINPNGNVMFKTDPRGPLEYK